MKTKFKYLFIIYCAALLISSCKSTSEVVSYTAEVTPLQDNTAGEIFLRCNGYDKSSKDEAIANSEANAFKAILFKGITGTQQVRPLVENETESRKNNADFYENFFDKKGYRDYIISATSTKINNAKDHNIGFSTDIKINLSNLRTNLEQKNIIRKFGW